MNKRNKRISVITLNVRDNYGGVLQAYALQCALSRYAPMVTTSVYKRRFQTLFIYVGFLRRALRRYILQDAHVTAISPRTVRLIESKIVAFAPKHINVVSIATAKKADAVVVGSDQVWRASYADPKKYFLGDFKNRLVKMSYAASFGRDDISEYSSSQIRECRKLIASFNGVSVREDTGISIVRNELGASAEYNVDPTLLLNRENYEALIEDDSGSTLGGKSARVVYTYVLDGKQFKSDIANMVSRALGAELRFGMKEKPMTDSQFRSDRKKYSMITVGEWLNNFKNAEFVVTDSFHGTVFSIIFNKPFIAIGNKERGFARFVSLLNMFGLKHRLVTSETEVTEKLITEKIDWLSVNAKIKLEQKRSFDYLKKHLG